MKGRKTALQSSFELFHIREKEVPIDVFECEQYLQEYDPNEPTKGFEKRWACGSEWEPDGNRFCVFYGPNDVTAKVHVRIFKPQIGTNRIKELSPLERTQVNGVHWCPTGRYLVSAAFRKFDESEILR